jgi:hypothetical protein
MNGVTAVMAKFLSAHAYVITVHAYHLSIVIEVSSHNSTVAVASMHKMESLIS